MTVEQALTTYVVAATVLTLTPGVDTALVLRTATAEGPKPAAGAATGIVLGLLLWGGMVSIGLGGLLAASATAYTCLRWVGAAYLFFLGVKLLLHPRISLASRETDGSSDAPSGARSWLVKGLFTNLLNPKIGVFYVTFLPQFVPTGVPVASWTFLLAVIHAATVVLWFALLIAASVPLGKLLKRARVIQTLDRITGGIFIAFGAKLALIRS